MYEEGFGELESCRYRIDNISCLTQNREWQMRIDIQNSDKTWTYYHYNSFQVGAANDGYPLTIGGYTLKVTDYFASLNGMKFSTPDVNNNKHSRYHCAKTYAASSWWYITIVTQLISTQSPLQLVALTI